MTDNPEIAIDTSVLVGLVDSRDTWHDSAWALHDALKVVRARLIYPDCVVNEAVSVLARRARERKHVDEFPDLLGRLLSHVDEESITWLSSATKRLYRQIMDLVRDTSGELNFHDALIALGCRDLHVERIATFDGGFERITWLKRLHDPQGVREAYQESEKEDT